MGKKQSQAEAPKNDKKQMNSLIKVLRPKVYITDSSNFKRLVQELTGNGNRMPLSVPPAIPEPTMEVPIVDIDRDHASSYRDRSLDSSEARMPASFTGIESPGELCAPDTFNVLESCFASHHHTVDFPAYGDIESWLMETDNNSLFSYNCHASIPTTQQQVNAYNYDFSDVII